MEMDWKEKLRKSLKKFSVSLWLFPALWFITSACF